MATAGRTATTPALTLPRHRRDDGPRVRAAKDRVGRHGEGYGNPVRSTQPAGDVPQPKPRGVTSSQGSRSFGLGRKRAL